MQSLARSKGVARVSRAEPELGGVCRTGPHSHRPALTARCPSGDPGRLLGVEKRTLREKVASKEIHNR